MTTLARTVEAELDVSAFTDFATREGWGDGLPLVPPTPALVSTYLEATRRSPDQVIAHLPPTHSACTVHQVAVNAAMTGAPQAAMDLLCSSIEAMASPDFNLDMLNPTTAPVVPAIVVNGPIRSSLDLPSGRGCLGGAVGPGPSIGRALRLVMRNVAGQRVGSTSESVFGQPGRVVGIVVAEAEENSPWQPLAQRRGVEGDAVTCFGAMGTMNICDTVAERATSLCELLGKSLAYLGANPFLAATGTFPGQVALAINPTWANDVLAPEIADIADLQQAIWDHAAAPIDSFPGDYQEPLEQLGRVGDDGRVHLLASPDDLIIFVCGGPGSLHATAFHGYGHTLTTTMPIES